MTNPPMSHADIPGNGNIIVQIVGDGNQVVVGHAHLTLTRYFNRRRLDPNRELDLLSPYSRSVPLFGREREQRELWDYLQSDKTVAVRILVGEGGSGKTRLALELCEQAAERGWVAGFATSTELQRFFAQQNLSQWGWKRPTLMIVDYAASHAQQLKGWLAELANHSANASGPLRILLLERHADDQSGWWQTVFASGGWVDQGTRALLAPEEPIKLAPLATATDRMALLQAVLDKTDSGIVLPSDEGYRNKLMQLTWGGHPLFLLMAALQMKQKGSEHALNLHRRDLAYVLADRERGRIKSAAKENGLDPTLVAHLAACATLAQGCERAAFMAFAEREKLALNRQNGGDAAALTDLLHELLPAPDRAISPILPDLIGEAYLLRAFDDGEAVPRCIDAFSQSAITALIRCAQDYSDPNSEPRPLHWLKAVIDQARDDLTRLMVIDDELPGKSLVLAELNLDITLSINSQYWDLAENDPVAHLPSLATSLHKLSSNLRSLGRHEEALKAIGAAVKIRHRLAIDQPDSFLYALAMSLNNQSNCLGTIGQHEDALKTIEAATAHYRQLAESKPESFLPDLASSLSNQSIRLIMLGRPVDALKNIEEAVTIRRQLAANKPDATFMPDLASALNNLSGCLSDLGRHEDALKAIEEATTIRRQLATSRPDSFLPDFAMSLNNLSICLDTLGRPADALTASEEAVTIQRPLAINWPDVLLPDLAMSLDSLSNHLGKLNRHEDALKAIEEAVTIRRQLATSRPDAFLSDLAMSLNNLAGRLITLNRPKDALTAGEEAATIQKQLAITRPDTILPDLATSLNNQSVIKRVLGLHKEAFKAIEEAVVIRRQLAATRPNTFLPDLAMSLGNLSCCLNNLNQPEDALVASKEAVSLLAPFFLRLPQAYERSMRNLLGVYLQRCEDAEHKPDAELLEPLMHYFFKGDDDA